MKQYPALSLIDTPKELRQLPKESLLQLCTELRNYLLNSVSRSSGHLASGLGTIELTVALHYVYDTPFDQIIWDVGHQAYPHKILTGRRDQLSTIRQRHGLHPFPWREESAYDVLSVGHSSTSISAGIGLAIAAEREALNRRIVSVIGDGAMTGGMAFEAMNHAGDIKPNILVILNDNEMSISRNVGALTNHLAQVLTGQLYTSFREGGKRVLANVPPIKQFVKKTEEHLKGLMSPGSLFEELGFNYVGPIDGHDVHGIIQTLQNMRHLKGPQLLHVMTKKGKGYAPAENDPITWHGVSQFDPKTGTQKKKATTCPSFSTVFGDWLCETASSDTQLMAITPAMCEGSGMVRFSREYPQNYFDVAIAEQHAVTFAAGLAIGGYKPVVAIYSTFLQRAYDQLIHDVAIPKLPVLFAIDRAGIVGPDGQTHQGAFDLSYLRCIPNLVIMTPSDEHELRNMLHTGYCYNEGPVAVRYPKGYARSQNRKPVELLPIGKGVIKQQGRDMALLNFGTLLPEVLSAAETFQATVVDMRFVKPLDENLLLKLSKTHTCFITIEENSIKGGAGSGINEFLLSKRLPTQVLNIGLPDYFIPPGTQDEIRQELQLDAEGIKEQIKKWSTQ